MITLKRGKSIRNFPITVLTTTSKSNSTSTKRKNTNTANPQAKSHGTHTVSIISSRDSEVTCYLTHSQFQALEQTMESNFNEIFKQYEDKKRKKLLNWKINLIIREQTYLQVQRKVPSEPVNSTRTYVTKYATYANYSDRIISLFHASIKPTSIRSLIRIQTPPLIQTLRVR